MWYGYKFRIYPDKEQEQRIKKTFGCCRFLYNHFLAERISAYKETGRAVGIDMGITSYAVSSDGVKYPNHKYLARAQKRLSPAQKRLSRLPADCASARNQPTYGGGYAESPAAKPKESKNREKARITVAVLHEKVSNQRRDTIHKLTAKLVRENDIICIEDLTVKNMMRNHHLAKSIADAAWYEFRRQLEYNTLTPRGTVAIT